jgi:hypothetical protein
MTMNRCLGAVSAALALAAVGCGGGTHCIEGSSQACSCTDGRTGAQVCNASGTFEACVCGGPSTDASMVDASTDPTIDAPISTFDGAVPDAAVVDAASECAVGAACECAGGALGYCEGAGCVCDPGPVPCAQDVDWLFLVDTSNSMTEEQIVLANEIPRLVRVLASGDANGDGTRDFTPVRSLHLGVVTPDLGVGTAASVPTCDSGPGDDGILQRTGTGCASPHPSGVFEFMPGGATTPDAFAASFACVAQAGTGGCGFEQQLEAPLRALSPSAPTAWTREGYVPPTFRDGSFGHALDANAGFLRDESVLAITLVTDEEDCSTNEADLYLTEGRFPGPFNLRCTTYADTALLPVSRYVDGLLGLRTHPGLLVFSAITGVPDRSFADYDAMLADPEMGYRVNDSGTNVEPSCTGASGVAFPARRMVEVARDLDRAGVQTSVSSICASSYETAVSDIVRALITARGSC